MVDIKRQRFIITRNEGKEVLCGYGKQQTYRPVDNIGGIAVRTYSSKEKAVVAFEQSVAAYVGNDCEVVEVVEEIREV